MNQPVRSILHLADYVEGVPHDASQRQGEDQGNTQPCVLCDTDCEYTMEKEAVPRRESPFDRNEDKHRSVDFILCLNLTHC